jgi:hypothetical protein
MPTLILMSWSRYFILDIESALSLVRAGGVPDGSSSGCPSEAELTSWLTQAKNSFTKAFLRHVVVPPHPPSTNTVAGLTFRDPYPANITHHGNPGKRPSAQVEAAAGMAAMDEALSHGHDATRAALGHMLAGLLMNVSRSTSALQVGGVIDMAQLGRSLVSYGRPDAAFALLSTNGSTSLYHMAASTGTIWAHPGGADGDNGKCSSHNHVMQGGSVGEGLFGIGGIQPHYIRGEVPTTAGTGGQAAKRLVLAPVPWLPDAPRGSAVRRGAGGLAATSWAAQIGPSGPHELQWRIWVNATVPAEGRGSSEVHVMLPQATRSEAVCAWECGYSLTPGVATFKSQWVSFDSSSSTGHQKLTAVLPSSHAAAAAPDTESSSLCAPLWRAGVREKVTVAGIDSVSFIPAKAGSRMYPALTVAVGSGSFAFFARSC